MPMIKEYNILISSVGGQGGVTLARIISEAAVSQGLRVRVGETLGMAQRGGSVQSHVRLGENVYGPLIPRGRSDVLLSLEPAEALRVVKYIGRRTTVIMNTFPMLPISVMLKEATYPRIEDITRRLTEIGGKTYTIDATELAKEAGAPESLNIVMLGCYMALGEQVLRLGVVMDAISSNMRGRNLEGNLRAFEMGMSKMKELISK